MTECLFCCARFSSEGASCPACGAVQELGVNESQGEYRMTIKDKMLILSATVFGVPLGFLLVGFLFGLTIGAALRMSGLPSTPFTGAASLAGAIGGGVLAYRAASKQVRSKL